MNFTMSRWMAFVLIAMLTGCSPEKASFPVDAQGGWDSDGSPPLTTSTSFYFDISPGFPRRGDGVIETPVNGRPSVKVEGVSVVYLGPDADFNDMTWMRIIRGVCDKEAANVTTTRNMDGGYLEFTWGQAADALGNVGPAYWARMGVERLQPANLYEVSCGEITY